MLLAAFDGWGGVLQAYMLLTFASARHLKLPWRIAPKAKTPT